MENIAEIIFGKDQGEAWRNELKRIAFNKSYEPPNDPILLARQVIAYLKQKNELDRNILIAVRKELSELKRKK